jgi:hypothetical protein
MIPVKRKRSPKNFNRDCRIPGNQWLAAHPTSDTFPAHWTRFQPHLARAFSHRCGWWAVRIADGAVDHYLSTKNRRDLAYKWSNYRYIAPSVNSSKSTYDDKVLDPFKVRTGWFEVILPSMQLVRTNRVPARLQAKADFTVRQLKLANGNKIRQIRRGYYEDHKLRGLRMNLLRDYAPLVAKAVESWQRNNPNSPLP